MTDQRSEPSLDILMIKKKKGAVKKEKKRNRKLLDYTPCRQVIIWLARLTVTPSLELGTQVSLQSIASYRRR